MDAGSPTDKCIVNTNTDCKAAVRDSHRGGIIAITSQTNQYL